MSSIIGKMKDLKVNVSFIVIKIKNLMQKIENEGEINSNGLIFVKRVIIFLLLNF